MGNTKFKARTWESSKGDNNIKQLTSSLLLKSVINPALRPDFAIMLLVFHDYDSQIIFFVPSETAVCVCTENQPVAHCNIDIR